MGPYGLPTHIEEIPTADLKALATDLGKDLDHVEEVSLPLHHETPAVTIVEHGNEALETIHDELTRREQASGKGHGL